MEKSVGHRIIEGVVVLAEADASALAQVRTLPGLRVGQAAGEIWLRGIPVGENAPLEIRKLPVQQRFELDEEDRLFFPGALTPSGTLPDLVWSAVATYMRVEPPTSALPGHISRQIAVQLLRTDQVHAGDALLTDLPTWRAFAETAPAVRLSALRFAVSDAMQVLILGKPLPPLPGQELRSVGTLLLPCGFDFSASIMAELIENKYNPIGDQLLYFHSDGNWERIPLRSFVPATRSAARLSPIRPQTDAS